jgi:hypothetical protein
MGVMFCDLFVILNEFISYLMEMEMGDVRWEIEDGKVP